MLTFAVITGAKRQEEFREGVTKSICSRWTREHSFFQLCLKFLLNILAPFVLADSYLFSAPFLVARAVKNPAAVWETQVRYLGREDPVFLSGKSHGPRSRGGYSPWGCKELGMIE